jgi:hypothetical protein
MSFPKIIPECQACQCTFHGKYSSSSTTGERVVTFSVKTLTAQNSTEHVTTPSDIMANKSSQSERALSQRGQFN